MSTGIVIYYYFHERGVYLTVVRVNKPVFRVVNLARPRRAGWR
jgi:hypothetical protein